MTEPRLAVIRTSDRSTFRRCRRKWAWGSSLKQNRTTKDNPSYFWIGTGGHFALEDYYGYNHFQHPVEAAKAFVEASRLANRVIGHGLPDDWEEQASLLYGILENYTIWAQHRDEYETVWIDGEPQVEITAHIPLPIEPPPGFDGVVYQFTLDRLVEINGEYWILDWKFYKSFSQSDLDYDEQMSSYIWAAGAVFERAIAGGILHEFKKTLPKPPRILGSGKISTAESQGTTHGLYRTALINLYGSVEKAPNGNVKTLNNLAMRESADRDDFIRRARTRRPLIQQQSTGTKILMEGTDMCNPDLPLYPNPHRDCSWDCSLKEVCLMMDRDDDWEFTLNDLTVQRQQEAGEWRNYLTKV